MDTGGKYACSMAGWMTILPLLSGRLSAGSCWIRPTGPGIFFLYVMAATYSLGALCWPFIDPVMTIERWRARNIQKNLSLPAASLLRRSLLSGCRSRPLLWCSPLGRLPACRLSRRSAGCRLLRGWFLGRFSGRSLPGWCLGGRGLRSGLLFSLRGSFLRGGGPFHRFLRRRPFRFSGLWS